MKKVFILLIIGSTIGGYSQTTKTNSILKTKRDSLELSKLQSFGAAYAKEMSTWSEEYRVWFVKNFFYVRGEIKIPTEPMTPPPPKY